MLKILDAIRLYFRYLGISMRAQMQYRASFLMMTVGQCAATGIEFLGIWALFARFGSLRGWTLPEVALFYGIINCGFAVAESLGRGFDIFPELVKSGDFDRVLLRPRSTILQIAGREFQLMRFGRLAQGLAVLIWALLHLKIVWDFARAALLCATIGSAAYLFYGLLVLQATMSFWTVETLEILNTVTYGGTETGQYPLTIYRPWFRRFFTFVVPIACANYLPVGAILGMADPLGASTWAQWSAPAGGFVFLLISLQIWKVGVRHYRSTGS
ncbi:MAG TPA: ABC-2 family transporter protein [Armatimonadota bacterium]|nr:ABC-2 family transporter protein [Armatimonadota bacterium]